MSEGRRVAEQQETTPELEALLEYLQTSRGFDVTGYRRSGLSRRVSKRVQALGLSGYPEYQDFLEVDPDEFARLFDTILINVTSFFRDEPSWEYLREEVAPALAAERPEHEPIRVWSAGCANGQESYSVLMTMAEALGADRVRERVKVYATDLDADALNRARQARYTRREVESVPSHLLERYFEEAGSDYVFSPDLRRSVIFGRHDLTADAPISRIDLLVCRNTLMYFNAETQSRILDRLHFALRDGGVLFLGKAETLLTHASLFVPVDLGRRMFRKVVRPTLRDRLLAMADVDPGPHGAQARAGDRLPVVAFQTHPEGQVVVDVNGLLAAANDQARTLFRITPNDIGRPFHDLDLSFRPVELRSRIQQAYAERRVVVVNEVEWPNRADGIGFLDVKVIPMIDREGRLLGVTVSFTDVTRYRQLHERVEHAHRELEGAYAELQSTNEELETTNEELQSTVEELETTNEELQSTNEELETTNEELQSTVEELETINDELSRRTGELNEVNAYLESILTSVRGGVVVLDHELRVRVWNHRSEDLWGIRADEAQGQYFLNLDIGMPVHRLRPLLQDALGGSSEPLVGTFDATNRRGRPIRVRVTCNALRGGDTGIRGVFVFMEEQPPEEQPAATPATQEEAGRAGTGQEPG